jgi:hypothetical protein
MTAPGNTSAVGVDDLDPAGVLNRLADAEVRDRAVQREKLQLAHHWCVLHPATPDTGAATWGDTGLPGLSDCDASLAGDGTPGVAAFAAEPLGAALGVSTQSAMALIADTLDLHHRLPRLWHQVQTLAIAPWKARRVATDTRTLPLDAARWVDQQLATLVTGFGLPTIERTVALAAARYAPAEQATNQETGRAGWHVTLTHPRPGQYAGTSWLEAAGDTTDLTAFHDLVCAEARLLGRLGDTEDYGARQAKALGIIAARQATLDLVTPETTTDTEPTTDTGTAPDTDTAPDTEPDTGPGPGPRTVLRRPVQATLFLHLSLSDLAAHLADGTPAIGEAERLGPVTVDLIRTWLQDSQATIRPVLDLARTDTVDRHDPPPWMREQVILRDRHCVFPWCGRAARACDLDHIHPYDDTGPPGQTRPDNLAALCRRHHRAKTFTGWTYHRHPDGSYTWTGPHHRTYRVGPDGTHATGPPGASPPASSSDTYTLAT